MGVGGDGGVAVVDVREDGGAMCAADKRERVEVVRRSLKKLNISVPSRVCGAMREQRRQVLHTAAPWQAQRPHRIVLQDGWVVGFRVIRMLGSTLLCRPGGLAGCRAGCWRSLEAQALAALPARRMLQRMCSCCCLLLHRPDAGVVGRHDHFQAHSAHQPAPRVGPRCSRTR